MKSNKIVYSMAVLWLSSQSAVAEVLSLQRVLSSTLEHHPRIAEQLQEIEAARGRALAAEGRFDWEIEQDSQLRTSGFYSGWYLDQKIKRRLEDRNVTISGGYRIADGSFPVYEAVRDTLAAGEANLTISMALLRGREVDPERTRLANARLALQATEENVRWRINNLLEMAGQHFIDWYAAYQTVRISKNLLQLAEDILSGTKVQLENGEVAEILLTEAEANVLARRATLAAAEQQLAVAGVKLALFLRDANGQPTPVVAGYVPEEPPLNWLATDAPLESVVAGFSQHPEILRLEQQIRQSENDLRLAKNNYLPDLDVKVAVANDFGGGPRSLQGLESYVGLNFSVPLERRQARGEINAAEARLAGLQKQRQQVIEQLTNEAENLLVAIAEQERIYALRQKQAEMAEKLSSMERRRFKEGGSDLFLLNAREISAASARIGVVAAYADKVTLRLELLGLMASLVSRAEQK